MKLHTSVYSRVSLHSLMKQMSSSQGAAPDLNHMLVLDLEPAMNQQNFQDIKMSN